MSFDPGKIMSEVEAGATRLEKAADVYSSAVENFEDLENEVELRLAKYRVEADSEYRAENQGKYPSKERRADVAVLRLSDTDPQLVADFAAAKATKEAQAVRFRALAAAVSARQSLLKALQG